MKPFCAQCGKNPATCIGEYETCEGNEQPACNSCCQHGNEDGHCRPIVAAPSAPAEEMGSAMENLYDHCRNVDEVCDLSGVPSTESGRALTLVRRVTLLALHADLRSPAPSSAPGEVAVTASWRWPMWLGLAVWAARAKAQWEHVAMPVAQRWMVGWEPHERDVESFFSEMAALRPASPARGGQ